MKLRGIVLATLVSCGAGPLAQDATGPTDDGPQRYEADAMVLQAEGQPALLCLGTVLDSLPPQCGDVPIVGWNWGEVVGEDQASGVTWGDYHVEGTFDGTAFTVASVEPRPPARSVEGDPFATPCAEPGEGWISPNPSMASESDRMRALRVAEDHADFAGSWIDYLAEDPLPEDPGSYVLNVAFTGDPGSPENDLRAVWGGPLCIVQFDRTEQELRRIQETLSSPGIDDFGVRVLWSSIDVMRNQVEIGVVTSDGEALEALDAAFGSGVVRVIPALRPIL